MTLVEYRAGLRRVPDDEIFPRMPPDAHLTVAPSTVSDCSFFLKRAGLDNHDSGEFWHGGPPCHEVLVNEVLTMEKLAQHPRPSIVRYHGRRVRRGRITGFYLEQLHQTLHEYAQTHAFAHIDKESFWQDVAPAVEHIHALRLAHNDISSLNIMVRREDASPVLIDFGSCQPLGEKVLSAGSPGWSEGNFSTSDMKHDIYSLGVLKRWLQNPKIDLMTSESERCDA